MAKPKNVTDKLNDILGVAKEILHQDEFVVSDELKAIKELSGDLQTMPTTVEDPEHPRIPRIKATEEFRPSNYDNDLENDYYHARQVLRGLIMNGELTLDALLCVAQDGQNARAYEVAGQLIRTIGDVTKDLMGLQKTIKELKREQIGDNKQVINAETVQNNTFVFTGTTSDLQKMIREQMGRNNVIDVTPEK